MWCLSRCISILAWEPRWGLVHLLMRWKMKVAGHAQRGGRYSRRANRYRRR